MRPFRPPATSNAAPEPRVRRQHDPVETQLAKDAKAGGAQVVNGLEMLLHQGAASLEIWTGKAAPVVAMRQALLRQLR